MDRIDKEHKDKKGFLNVGMICLHAFTSIVLGIFVVIWLLRGIGYEAYQILSGSMEPTLMTGEIVLINTNDQDVKVGEIIAFRTGDHVVIHRIANCVSDCVYITKGDANISEDLIPVEQWQILGTMWIKLGNLTHIWLFFTSKGGLFLVIGLVILHGIYDGMWNWEKKGDVGYA